MESLVEELVQTGLLQKYKPSKIAAFKGTFNLMNDSTTKSAIIEPSLADIRRTVIENCILPLGFTAEQADTSPNKCSLFLYGTQGCGKSLLVNSIASEAGAHLFNLSPRNTATQFIGKGNVTKMVHMVFKVARAHAPAIVYIDNAEMIFAKKVPKDDTSDPKRIKKDLMKALKSLTPSDRVIVIATSNKPWDADPKAMLPVFDKYIYIPKPDYASRLVLWRSCMLDKSPLAPKHVNTSLLSRITSGYSSGDIVMAVERVLTERRVKMVIIE